jgi:hypothetical protein
MRCNVKLAGTTIQVLANLSLTAIVIYTNIRFQELCQYKIIST